ncbi:hypothetical protein GOP47_0024268 [Adiantum capillus-veneris]|uniref:Pentatricopeptide repeat-containing protein n=1 Tax=Adiantum capillus-veneris TaxID=13818 RepID=A0A9D4Z448_ADICA|nr:hypothetical protein GOP47_0024268 [Adiantum capillus-veneris]
MYVKCGALVQAQQVPLTSFTSRCCLLECIDFGICSSRGRSGSSGLFSADAKRGHLSKSNHLHVQSGIMQDVNMGKRVHDDIVSQGLLTENVVLGTALVVMYCKCGVFHKAQKVLEELLVWNVVSWNVLITGYAQQRQGQEALGCFQQMQREGISPNVFTYTCILKACGITQDADMGKRIHDDIVSQGLLTENLVLGTTLVDMYAKCDVLHKALTVCMSSVVYLSEHNKSLTSGMLSLGVH